MRTPLLVAAGIGIGIALMGARYTVLNRSTSPLPDLPGQTPPPACTEEAKLCPDGSAVGRTGPNCEFAPCPDANITITSPQAGDTISLPYTVEGQARTFESVVEMRVELDSGMAVYRNVTTAQAPDIGQYGPYQFVLTPQQLGSYAGQTVTITVFESSAKDGSEINVVERRVQIAK